MPRVIVVGRISLYPKQFFASRRRGANASMIRLDPLEIQSLDSRSHDGDSIDRLIEDRSERHEELRTVVMAAGRGAPEMELLIS